MASAWRITKAQYADPPYAAFDGEGARRRTGRWNHRGSRMAYASTSLSLAALEYFVNLSPEDAPAGLVHVQVDIPEIVPVEQLKVGDLPAGWSATPGPGELRDIGERWLNAAATVALLVPSAVLPAEHNVLINPGHRFDQSRSSGFPEAPVSTGSFLPVRSPNVEMSLDVETISY